jgi:hypothetical protein
MLPDKVDLLRDGPAVTGILETSTLVSACGVEIMRPWPDKSFLNLTKFQSQAEWG